MVRRRTSSTSPGTASIAGATFRRGAASGAARTAPGPALTWPELSREVTQVAEALVSSASARGTASRSSCRCAPPSRSRLTPARTSARCRCRSSPASPRPRSPRGSRTRAQGGDLRRLVLPARRAHRDAGDARAGERRRRRVLVVEPRRRLARARDEATGHARAGALDSEAPYLLAYTSGTTGRPKGALHVQGGFLVSIAREVAYQTDVKRGDRVFFSTDMGWIMGPWTVVGAGACGATVIYTEGAPDWPARPAVVDDRVGARDDARRLADADPRADPEGRPRRTTSRRCRRSARPASRGTAIRTSGLRAGRRRARPDRERVGRDGGRRMLPLHVHRRAGEAGRARISRARGPTSTSSTRRAARSAARSASSCAGSRGRG